jgi:recombination endonuclease VII
VIDLEAGTFTCRDCGTPDLPLAESIKDKSRKSGYMERCRGCDRKRSAARRADPDKGEKQRTAVREAMRTRRSAREAAGLPWTAEYTEEQVASKRDRQRIYARHSQYAKIGVTDEDYWGQLAKQGGKCAMCPRTTPTHGDERFCFDHDHKTGKRRGLLCRFCNLGIGYLQDDPALLRVGADYLEAWRDAA